MVAFKRSLPLPSLRTGAVALKLTFSSTVECSWLAVSEMQAVGKQVYVLIKEAVLLMSLLLRPTR